MSLIKVTLELNDSEFPILNTLKKKDLEKYVLKIFKTGYMIHFPSNEVVNKQIEHEEIIERIENIKEEIKSEINNSDIGTKLNSLETSLTKLIGISSNSWKKGNFGENMLEEIFSQRYGDVIFERKSSMAHSADAWLHLPDDNIIMLEIKNYQTTVNKEEVEKLKSDMITHNIRWGLFVSFNSSIQGMKEMDYYTFTHNNTTYSVIMISNLANDIHKLDLGLQIIRKLISQLDNAGHFPWVVKDITTSLLELNQIIDKNYALRDSYYSMEKNIQKLMSEHHVILRDYQYDIEKKIKEITNKIHNTMHESNDVPNNYQTILDEYKDDKILPIIVRFVDVAQNKKWVFNFDNTSNEWVFNHMEKEVGRLKVQAKKAIISIPENEITFKLQLGKEKEIKQNLEIIKSL